MINSAGTRAYVNNFVSRNVSIVNLKTDSVIAVVKTTNLPAPGSDGEVVLVGAQMFFSSRGHFDQPAGPKISVDERLAQVGWQACSSCHFKGLTDGVVWTFNTGPRKSIPLNGTFDPQDRKDTTSEQRILTIQPSSMRSMISSSMSATFPDQVRSRRRYHAALRRLP